MNGMTLRSQGSQCFFSLQEDFFFVKFDSRRDDGELNISCVFQCLWPVVHSSSGTCCESARSGRTRGGRETVTQVNNHKHKLRTAKTLGVEPFSGAKTKKEQNPSKGVTCRMCRQQPQPVSPCKTLCSVVPFVLSPTLLTVIDPKKLKISCSNSFCGLIFSSSSNAEIVCKYHPKRIEAKGAKSSSPMVSFFRPNATSHISSMHLCTKVPRRP